MKIIEIDDELYHFIAAQTKHIGESASDILRRLLLPAATNDDSSHNSPVVEQAVNAADSVQPKATAPKPAAKRSSTPRAKPATPAPPITHGTGDILGRLSDNALSTYTKRVDLFLFILAELYNIHGEDFAKVEQIKGKNRIYFATSKDALLNTGSSTNPKAIPDSPYWVVTNNNTAKKVAMLEQVLTLLGYGEQTSEAVIAKFA
ncbi:replication initiation negative regulator SeqA [Alteromonas sp. C1M14]|uniref:replication initiation negative regulator SeqA n=1 Tax=Alteromonas sp. C1M14 TaxID=2841567 RepID=UPI001C08F3E6|nr:replication initiation negative regulator SeqA [Alteromonas sp. C1M14]MBU2978892.1 replication initiation negative regulator SeqA [Alteromonas sp. C1M14]